MPALPGNHGGPKAALGREDGFCLTQRRDSPWRLLGRAPLIPSLLDGLSCSRALWGARQGCHVLP